MASINLLERKKPNFKPKLFLPIFSKETTSQNRFSKDHLSTSIPKPPTKTLSRQCFKCLGFGHTANCPTKRTMMVKWGVVVSAIVPNPLGLALLPLQNTQVKKSVKYHMKVIC